MRQLIVLAFLLSAGCQGVIGPREPRQPIRVDDPRVSIAERHARFAEEVLGLVAAVTHLLFPLLNECDPCRFVRRLAARSVTP